LGACDTRYRKIRHDGAAIESLLVTLFLQAHGNRLPPAPLCPPALTLPLEKYLAVHLSWLLAQTGHWTMPVADHLSVSTRFPWAPPSSTEQAGRLARASFHALV
jgi:hypothetical protein